MSDGVEIYEIKKKELKGGIVVDGFPSVGLVSSIVANYLINLFDLEQIGVVDSIYFPTVSLIKESEPLNPVRIYATREEEESPLVVFISEFQPSPNIIKPIASAMLDWAIEQRCSLVISPEGLVVDTSEVEGKLEEDDIKEQRLAVYGVGSTKEVRDLIKQHDEISEFTEGIISGVAGVLLNEGKMRDFPVLGLLTEAHPDYPDARSAAKVIEIMDKIILNRNIDAEPLYREAEKVEAQIKALHQQSGKGKKGLKKPLTPSMYG
ncbi:MAG: proteasome assembly chaperone family protein [Thermoplasmata archaeon]|nr:proteasome assembly chaperone family protein [Thermoplasmata archaeon]